MTRYAVELTGSAAKQLRKLDQVARRRVLVVLTELEVDPRPPDVKKLVGLDNAWRIRIGDYRVLYEIVDELVLVTVFRIANRRDVHRDL
ncbi:type II toxin-antitoxin system RelE/ParE family toxin [Agromyces sp. ISL-38]|uniref:type II toxin-antitoxin system RelE family toxin n=1 Tax=Agromyces sp. ISL-38 TaxID=2819107 RepID=UPI001BE6AB26|nr:type II toxin-antitoxin system RelE/ParE family toxin [Agromyces sp. ISL-38]MBT2497851.1 type II toxin-antitoxin system RelE/ParE family toxin [Agromyces sp. ISL-38]MBT2517061.1 type II toxin-antitoxin system RelE/ParE family toxin [Streptomyces sp. ISL-90]